MSEETKLAVLIDSDNVSAKYAHFIMQEVLKYGTPTYKRVYGDWEKGGNGWHDAAINYSIMPVQQCSYIAGKNATDFSMIIDAMDILYTSNVDGFCLVTSDSDFTRLAIRLREAGKLVIGIGELKTPRAFTISCHHFCYLNQVCEPEGMQDEKTIRRAVIDYVTENDGERIDLAKISAVLTSRFGNINFSELGFKRFSGFVDSFPELKRSNTFVSLKKRPQKSAAKPSGAELTEEVIAAAVAEYFSDNAPERDNMLKIESYLNSRFGKIDFSRFGSKRFARFIDKLPQFKRTGTYIEPVSGESPSAAITAESLAKEVTEYALSNAGNGANIGQLNNLLISKYGKAYFRALGYGGFKAALSSVDGVRIEGNLVHLDAAAPVPAEPETQTAAASLSAVAEYTLNYARGNMPDGGNIGQLNNELIGLYGKSYFSDLGFGDFKSMLAAVSGVKVLKNHIFTDTDAEPSAENEEQSPVPEQTETPFEKPEINAVKRDVLSFAAEHENEGSLAALGALLAEKYGADFLKALGLTSMRKLTAEITGVSVKNNRVILDSGFAQQTEEIEQFVKDFARADGSRSIRALGIKLKENFEGFDFKNYGFARFTDFINAIDGVQADRYHIKPLPEE